MTIRALVKALNDADAAALAVQNGITEGVNIPGVVAALAKAYGGNAQVAALVAFAKGLIGPGDIAVGGRLSPQQASKMISLVYGNDFLKEITTTKMQRLEYEGQVVDIPRRSLCRVDQGKEPEDDDKSSVDEFGYTLRAESAQLFVDLKNDFLLNNQDNPNLANELEGMFATRIQGELVDLAWNGTGNPASGKFLKLNKGFIQLLKDSIDAGGDGAAKTANINPAESWYDNIEGLWELVPDEVKAQCVIYMNSTDADSYAFQRGRDTVRTDDQATRQIIGKAIRPVVGMPAKHVVITPPKNLIVGMCQDVTRSRAYTESH
ncbi:MAG: hypothetical protein H7Z12_19825 [Rhodospirillaceae bacterium]|nr:hypothetical protein [Rhodospirillales bacterium]